MPVWHTVGVDDPVTQARAAARAQALERVGEARAAMERAEQVVTDCRAELTQAIADAVRGGEKLSKVAVKAGYTREHVRRVVRAEGIADVSGREPPPPRWRQDR
jgi:DNA-binding phage protein